MRRGGGGGEGSHPVLLWSDLWSDLTGKAGKKKKKKSKKTRFEKTR